MERAIPKPQEVYRHFKGNLYQIVTIATHSETGEQMVCYRQLYPPFQAYVRPLSMFLEEVDHVKYPAVKEQYRFTLVDMDSANTAAATPTVATSAPTAATAAATATTAATDTSAQVSAAVTAATTADAVTNTGATPTADAEDFGTIDPAVMDFLDAETVDEKLAILAGLAPRATDAMIDTMAIASGIEVEKGPVEERLLDLRDCLLTVNKYEQTRSRFR